MARNRIRLAFITNQSKRKASYNKRKNGLFKKLLELNVLCEVNDVAAIMYSEFEQEPVVWPSVEGVQQTIARFRDLPEAEQTRRMVTQESYILERFQKLYIKHLNLQKVVREMEMTIVLYKILEGELTIDSLDEKDLNDLGWVTNLQLAEIDSRVESIQIHQPQAAP